MAGNDGDLLKQATQAMMSRYEGKNTWLFSPPTDRDAPRCTPVVIFGAVTPAGRGHEVLHSSPLAATTVLVFSSACGCCFHDDVSRTCRNVKVDEGSYQCGKR